MDSAARLCVCQGMPFCYERVNMLFKLSIPGDSMLSRKCLDFYPYFLVVVGLFLCCLDASVLRVSVFASARGICSEIRLTIS